MSLLEAEKELEKELEQAIERESQEIKEEPVEEIKEEAPVEPEVVEEKAEEKPEEIKDEEDGFKLRRKAKAAEERAKKAEERLRELEESHKAQSSPKEEEAPLAPEVREMLRDHTITRAEKELQVFEDAARMANPDYDAVAAAYANSVFSSLRVLNPEKTQFELINMTKQKMLEQASGYLNKGYENPAEEMYHRAKEMGFMPKAKEVESKPEPKPDMAKLAANRARSANFVGSSGDSKGNPTPAHVASEYTAADIAKMSDAEFKSVISQIR